MVTCEVCGDPGTLTRKVLNGLPVGVFACDGCREAVRNREVGVSERHDGTLHITDGRVSYMNPINSFSGPHRFLSNFYIEPDGSHVEGEFQRAKCAQAQYRKLFDGKTPAQAKAIGRKVMLRKDWEDVKLEIMEFYVRKKFRDHPTLMAQLQRTKPAQLIEGNTWGDTFWGVCDGRGQNWLGAILEDVRG